MMHDLMFYWKPRIRRDEHHGALNTRFIHTGRRRKLSRRKSHQEIPNMDKCPAVFTERKKTDEFGIAIATIYGLFVCFKSSPGNKYRI